MKILAIRGCNLASLAGEFEIDLAGGPLGAAGVFAIIGNTGAGKSTLLDALCVALFDRTPRLTNHSRVVVGRGDEDPGALGAQDVRTLLRRGVASGWAEVDFESGDGRRYRSRWAVRRARGQIDGTLQPQQLSLTSLEGTGERLGGTKTETLEAIHARLGLTFDQFRRSALLAQGEFAAFLRADGKDRSELLERMTGTEIYSRLSIAAHLRAALAEHQLASGRAAAFGIGVLDDAARVSAEAELVLAEEAKVAARARLAAAELAARWSAEAEHRTAGTRDADAAWIAAKLAVDDAGALRAELGLRRRAEVLRTPWEDAARLDREHAIACGAAGRAREAEAAAAGAIASVTTRREWLLELQGPVREARVAAGLVEQTASPSATATILAAAHGLDELARAREARVTGVLRRAIDRLSAPPFGGAARFGRAEPFDAFTLPTTDATRAVQASRETRTDDLHGSADASFDAGALMRHADDLAAAMRGDAAWLLDRAPLGVEVAMWRELDDRFEQRAQLGDAIVALDRALATHAAARAKLERSSVDLADQHRIAVAKHGDAQRKAEALQKRRGSTLEVARQQEETARARVLEVERLVAIAVAARSASTTRDELDRRLAELAATDAVDHQQRTTAAAARDTARVVRDERTRVVEELRKAAGYAHVRAELVEGEPCPLCGAEAHPWRDRGAFDDVIATAAAALADATGEHDAALAALAAIAGREEARRGERARLVTSRVMTVATADDTCAKWREQLTRIGELSLVDDPASSEAALLGRELHVAATKQLEDARITRSLTEKEVKAAADAQAEVTLAHANLDHVALRLTDLARRIGELDAEVSRLAADRANKRERHDELATQIAAAAARWTGAIRTASDHDANVIESDLLPAVGTEQWVAARDRGAGAAPWTIAPRAKAPATGVALGGARADKRSVGLGGLGGAPAPASANAVGLGGAPAPASANAVGLGGAPVPASTSGVGLGGLGGAGKRSVGRGGLGGAPATASTNALGLGGFGGLGGAPATACTNAVGLGGLGGGPPTARTNAVGLGGLGGGPATGTSVGPSGRGGASAGAGSDGLGGASAGMGSERLGALGGGSAGTGSEGLGADTVVEASVDRRPASGRDPSSGVVERRAVSRGGRGSDHARPASSRAIRIDSTAPFEREAGFAAGSGPWTADRYIELRAWIAELATAWRACAERVAVADAALTAAGVAVEREARDAERAIAEHGTRVAELALRRNELATALAEATARFEEARTASGFDRDALHALLSHEIGPSSRSEPMTPVGASTGPARIEAIAEQLATLDRAVDTAHAVVAERRRLAADHAAMRPATLEDADRVEALAAIAVTAEVHSAKLGGMLAADTDARTRRAAAFEQLVAAEGEVEIDRVLGKVIGSHDGKLFRSFAQSLTLDSLLAVANDHLEELAPRYQLERVPRHDLELQVIDRDLGHDVRSVQSLSGGESFLVSLALALGLSSMSAHDVRVRTLLIDEGFGTLDPATLDTALTVLDELQARGRQVGVISHVPALVERVRAHVHVVQRGGGRSEVIVA